MLIEQQALPIPLLYVSAYMEENRREYYERLQAVRERGEIQEWLQNFLRAVKTQAEEAASRIGQLVDLRERYRIELKGVKSRAGEVMELFLRRSSRNPATGRQLADAAGVRSPTPRGLMAAQRPAAGCRVSGRP